MCLLPGVEAGVRESQVLAHFGEEAEAGRSGEQIQELTQGFYVLVRDSNHE